MKKYGSISEIADASAEELAQMPEIPADVAERIVTFFREFREKN